MARNYDGWAIKNPWGSLLDWTFGLVRRDVLRKIDTYRWKDMKKRGFKLIKVKLVEVEKERNNG